MRYVAGAALALSISLSPGVVQAQSEQEREPEMERTDRPRRDETPQFDLSANRTFTASNGQTVVGNVKEILSGGVVVLALENKSTIKARLDDLTKEDQDYVYAWYQEKVLKLGRSVSVTAKRGEGDGKPAPVLGTQPSGAITQTENKRFRFDKVGYEIGIRNTGPLPLRNVTVKALIFKKDKDDHEILFTAQQSFENVVEPKSFVTGSVTTTRFSGEVDESVSNGMSLKIITPSYRESVTGVWIRVYDGEVLIGELSEPGNLKQTKEWAFVDQSRGAYGGFIGR